MKKTFLIGIASTLFLLSACGAGGTLTYSLLISPSAHQLELIDATQRVVDRRLKAQEIKATVKTIAQGKDEGRLTVGLNDAQSVTRVKEMLAQPFTFDIRIDTAKEPKDAKGVTGKEQWIPVGLTGASLNWVQVVSDKTTGKIGIQMDFTDKGRATLSKVFSDHKGASLGFFVRDLLISKVAIATDKVVGSLIISGIPSATVGRIFADDVNVGTHVRFTAQDSSHP